MRKIWRKAPTSWPVSWRAPRPSTASIRGGSSRLATPNGANIAASLLLSHPRVLAGAVLFHAMVPLEPSAPPDLAGTPVFIAGGSADPMIPLAGTERLAALLRAGGAAVTLHWERDGHALIPAEVRAAQEWLNASGLLVPPA